VYPQTNVLRRDPAALFFGLAGLLTLAVSLPASYAVLAPFHDDGGPVGVPLALFAVAVFELGAVGAKLITLAIPQWSKRLTALTVVLLILTTGANYAHGVDLLARASLAPTLAQVRQAGGAPYAAVGAAALFPALLFVWLSAFVARVRQIQARADASRLQNNLLTAREADLDTREAHLTVREAMSQREAERHRQRVAELEEEVAIYEQQRNKPRSPTSRNGFVYLMRGDSNLYKIGAARDVQRRVNGLTMLPFQIEVVHTIATVDMWRLERGLHQCFVERHTRGEWFALTDQDVQLISEIEAVTSVEEIDEVLDAVSAELDEMTSEPREQGQAHILLLPAPDDVVALRDEHGLSFSQIGQRLGKSRQAVWQQYKAAKRTREAESA
jgi:hypothetical protein